jgi:hypothetical protein
MKNLNAAVPSWLSGILGKVALFGPVGDALKVVKDLSAYGNVQRNKTLENPSVQMFMTDQNNARLEREKLKTIKTTLDATKKNTAELKKQATAKKQSALFDLEKIGLVAALQGKITAEEKLRLELQMALLTGNEDLATKLSGQLANSIDKTGELKKWLTTLPDANNPFKGWDEWLKNFKSELATIGNGVVSRSPSGNVPNMPIASPDAVLAQASADFASANNTIRLIVEGGDEVTNLMRFKIQEAAQSGSTTNWSQTVGAWDR